MKSTALLSVVVGAAGVGVLGFALAASSKAAQPKAQPTQPLLAPQEAARLLLLYLAQPGINWGSTAAPNSTIQGAQRDMGGIVADGIYGPKTKARGESLTNKQWPSRPTTPQPTAAAKPAAAKPPATTATIPSNTVKVVDKMVQELRGADKPSAASTMVEELRGANAFRTPAPKAPTSTPAAARPTPNPPPGGSSTNVVTLPAQVVDPSQRTATQAARDLYNYVVPLIKAGRGAELGSKDKPNNTVAAAQRDMRGIVSDGIYGPKTQARGKELLGSAQTFPSRYGTGTKLPAANVLNQPPPTPAVTQTSEQARAAESLFSYVSKPGADFGARGKPSQFVKASQSAMGGVVADGIYGPATRARGAQLTGKTFPPRK